MLSQRTSAQNRYNVCVAPPKRNREGTDCQRNTQPNITVKQITSVYSSKYITGRRQFTVAQKQQIGCAEREIKRERETECNKEKE